MNRRNFLRTTGALSLPAFLSSGVAANPLGLFSQFINQDSDRVLVLIRLAGGNDGLNTLIGLDQLDQLNQVRGNIAIDAANTLRLTSTAALHGKMPGMKTLFDEGKLGVVQAVGYPNQNRSHFRSTDIWSSGSAADVTETSGWTGRYLELDHAGYPAGYPNETYDYPLAMTMGNVVSATCQGAEANLSIVVNNPFNYRYIAPGGDTPLPDNFYGDEVSYIRNLISQSNEYGNIVQEAANAGSTLATNYTEGNLSEQLRNIAILISGGLKTKIYVATLGGFDTHNAQVDGVDRLTGRHGVLMEELSGAIKAFTDDLEKLGVGHRVLGLTFSEFGRRIRSNESGGTDHGDAGPLFLFGSCVNAGIIGTNPEIDTEVSQNTGVPFQYDFRDVYGSVLKDWFEVPETTVQTLFGNSFTYLPLANRCANVAIDDIFSVTAAGEDDHVVLSWETNGGGKPRGFTVERGTDGVNFRPISRVAATNAAFANYSVRDTDVAPGQLYYYRVVAEKPRANFTTSSVQTARLRGHGPGDWTVGLPRPNPIAPDSYIKVYSPTDAAVTATLFTVAGQRVRTTTHQLLGARDNRVPLGPIDLPAGTYTWQMTTPGGRRFVRKLFVK